VLEASIAGRRDGPFSPAAVHNGHRRDVPRGDIGGVQFVFKIVYNSAYAHG